MPEKDDGYIVRHEEMTMQMKTLEVEVVRVKITLACTECKQRNYNMTKEKRNILREWKLRNIVSSAANTLCIRKQSNPR